MNIGQPIVAALKPICQFEVIDAKQVQHRGLQVVHVHRVFSDVVAEIVGRTVRYPGANATAGKPNSKAS